MFLYRMASDWLVFTGASYTRLGSGINHSPIVTRDSIMALHFGTAWLF